MAQLVIISGLPGAGKSSLVKKQFPNHLNFESDMYFINKSTGEYKFNHTKLNSAHKWCQNITRHHLLNGTNVVVSNTFLSSFEFDPYVDMCIEAEASLLVVRLFTQFQNVHGVTPEKLEIMRGRMQPWETIYEDCMMKNIIHVEYQEVR